MENSIADDLLNERMKALENIESICQSMLKSVGQAKFYARASRNKAKKHIRIEFQTVEGMYNDTISDMADLAVRLASIVDSL